MAPCRLVCVEWRTMRRDCWGYQRWLARRRSQGNCHCLETLGWSRVEVLNGHCQMSAGPKFAVSSLLVVESRVHCQRSAPFCSVSGRLVVKRLDTQLTVSETSDSPCIPWMESQLQHDQFPPGFQLRLDHCLEDSGSLIPQELRSANCLVTCWQNAFDAC